jgi:hypothetical protein
MKACNRCQLRGYSRELCAVHVRHCRNDDQAQPTSPSLRVSVRVALGVAVGVFAALVVVTAASFVSGMSVFHTLLPVLVVASSLAGGVCGLVQGLGEIVPRGQRHSSERRARNKKHDHGHAPRRTSSRPMGVFFIGHDDQRPDANRTSGQEEP